MQQYLIKILFIYIFTAVAFMGTSPVLMAQDVIRVTNGEWKPFQSEDLPNYGPYSEIVTEAFKRAGIEVEYGFFPWKRAQHLAKIGAWDATFFWVETKDRRRDYLLSDITFSVPEVLFFSKNVPLNQVDVYGFAGLTMGRIDGSAFGEQFNSLIEDGSLDVVYARDNESLFKMLSRGRVDFIPELLKSGYDAIDRMDAAAGPENLTHYDRFSYQWNYYFMASKKTKTGSYFIDAFNQGIASMSEDGSLNKILAPLIEPERHQ